MPEGKLINENTSYISKRNSTSIAQYRECLVKFSINFEKELSLKTNSPILLDTNVLLRYYSISFTARERLFEFIKSNKARVVITPQVQMEFIKNREDVIQRFFEQVTTKIPKDFNSDVVNRMKVFLEVHKVVLKDYPFVEEGIQKHRGDLESILQRLNETVELKQKELTNLIITDKLLDLLSICTVCDGLDVEELALVKKHFDSLAKSISTESADSILNKPNAVFPGFADIKNKPDDPYGDYIIFHEMMKYMIKNKTDLLFLTFDNSKGDWMNKNKSPHLHYTQNMYANSGQILYIIDAERTLEELLNVNIESLVTSNTDETSLTPITVETLVAFSKNYDGFSGVSQGTFTPTVVRELNLNGYKYMEELEKDCSRVEPALNRYLSERRIRLNTLGRIRVTLRILNNTYTSVNVDGTTTELGYTELKHLHTYRSLIKD